MISSHVELFDTAVERLSARLGGVDLAGDVMAFDFTHYYDRQMGSPLYRKFVSFERLVDPDALVQVKRFTNDLEAAIAAENPAGVPRPINLDPGYVEPSKLVLASMKNFSHRIYLGRGVYGEVTLMYHKGIWEALAWTFPDYASGRYHPFLTAVRDRLRQASGGRKPSSSGQETPK